jgi:hypothetical protein
MTWIGATYLTDSGQEVRTYINVDHIAAVTKNNEGRARIKWAIADASQMVLDEDWTDFIYRLAETIAHE